MVTGGVTAGADLSGGGTMSGPLTVFDTGAVYNPTQIYHMAYPQAVFNDASQGSQYVSASYAGTQRAGIAGYVVSDFAVNRGVGWGNGVAVMGVGVAHANGAMAWGINTLLTDSDNPVVVTGGTGRLLQNEFDFNVTTALSVRITGDLHVSGTIGTLSALEARVAALEARLAAAGL